ncbi:hypothetical protein KORDIASMS9_03930 [Kordia sp. SMS9]|uniref:hypothetical protein n=1 Tax=Kordia sp. SMS9 TaxID=2282170 RepID=UPI000E10B477|nr:hypothetical protein [Kordia sp. SMS9]AXG71673.1 hypothetical protein KORDIASMS9_03930 [Kordia sp. SMS9]
MKKYLFLFAVYFNAIVLFAQEKPTEYPDFMGQELAAIEKNEKWHILEKATGDLNNDAKDDVAIVIESKEDFIEIRCKDCPTSLSKARILLVLFCENDTFKVHTQNNVFIPRSDEGGMSSMIEPELTIEANQLKVSQQYTRSNVSYRFELQENQFMILIAESNSVHAASGDTEHCVFDFTKSEIIITEGNISNEEEAYENEEEGKKEKTTVIKFDKKPKSLGEFGVMHEWEIAKYRYL